MVSRWNLWVCGYLQLLHEMCVCFFFFFLLLIPIYLHLFLTKNRQEKLRSDKYTVEAHSWIRVPTTWWGRDEYFSSGPPKIWNGSMGWENWTPKVYILKINKEKHMNKLYVYMQCITFGFHSNCTNKFNHVCARVLLFFLGWGGGWMLFG